MKMTIARKLWLGYGTVMLLIAGVGYYAYSGSKTGQQGAIDLTATAQEMSLGTTVRRDLMQTRIAIKDFLLSENMTQAETFRAQAKVFDESLNNVIAELDTDRTKNMTKEIATIFQEYEDDFEKIAKTISNQNELTDNKMGPLGATLIKDLTAVRDAEYKAGNADNGRMMEQLLSSLLSIRLYVNLYLRTGDLKHYDAGVAVNTQVKDVLKAFEGSELVSKFPELKTVGARFDEYGADLVVMRNLVDERTALLKEQLEPAGQAMMTKLAEIQEVLTAEGADMTKRVTEQTARASTMGITITLIAVALCLVLSTTTVITIMRPLRAIINRLKDIAEGEGDLTKRVDENRGDELGEMGKWFNRFIQKIHDVIADVAVASREVASAATEIAASSEQMACGMAQQTEQTTQVSAAVAEMSSTVVEVARKSVDASQTAENAGRHATDGGNVVRQTVTGMKAIADVVSQSAEAVLELGRRGEQIDQIIGVINDIADQTNLLALNAAIEAARAGEHGRGFAVVADEVRKLAERTTHATKEVGDSIQAIKHDTSTAVQRMQSGTNKVSEGVQLAESAGSALGSIVEGAQNVATMIQSIAAASEQQSAASDQISRSIEAITAVTRQSSEGASQAASAAAQLSAKAEQLQGLISQFKLAKA